jgi:hypothetical protein
VFKTRIDLTKYFFLRSDDREIVFPWGGHLFFGARWAFVIPTDAMRRSMERDVRIYFWANIGIFAAACVLARWVGSHVLILAGLVVPSIIYGAFVKRRVRGLARIPARESVVLFARHLGQEKLWQQVFFGFFTFAVAVFFLAAGIIKNRPLTFPGWWLGCLLVAFFLANSVLALRGLRMLPTAEKPPVSGTNSGIDS